MSEISLCDIDCPVLVQRMFCSSANHHVICYGPRTMAGNTMWSTLVHKSSCSLAVVWALLRWAIREAAHREGNTTRCDYETTTQHHTWAHNHHHNHSTFQNPSQRRGKSEVNTACLDGITPNIETTSTSTDDGARYTSYSCFLAKDREPN
jgi:hypothetical protein